MKNGIQMRQSRKSQGNIHVKSRKSSSIRFLLSWTRLNENTKSASRKSKRLFPIVSKKKLNVGQFANFPDKKKWWKVFPFTPFHLASNGNFIGDCIIDECVTFAIVQIERNYVLKVQTNVEWNSRYFDIWIVPLNWRIQDSPRIHLISQRNLELDARVSWTLKAFNVAYIQYLA